MPNYERKKDIQDLQLFDVVKFGQWKQVSELIDSYCSIVDIKYITVKFDDGSSEIFHPTERIEVC